MVFFSLSLPLARSPSALFTIAVPHLHVGAGLRSCGALHRLRVLVHLQARGGLQMRKHKHHNRKIRKVTFQASALFLFQRVCFDVDLYIRRIYLYVAASSDAVSPWWLQILCVGSPRCRCNIVAPSALGDCDSDKSFVYHHLDEPMWCYQSSTVVLLDTYATSKHIDVRCEKSISIRARHCVS